MSTCGFKKNRAEKYCLRGKFRSDLKKCHFFSKICLTGVFSLVGAFKYIRIFETDDGENTLMIHKASNIKSRKCILIIKALRNFLNFAEQNSKILELGNLRAQDR